MKLQRVMICILIAVLAVQSAYAAPTTGAATDITSDNITFHATGATTPTWWIYGLVSGNLPFKTENVSASGGVANTSERGTPLMSNTKYYFRACDATGCGAELSATLAVITPAPASTFGVVAHNISQSHFDVSKMGGSVTEPFVWAAANSDIVFGVLLFFVFTGLWLRQREVILPILLGLIGSGLLIYSGATSVGIPPEMLIIVISLVAVGLTGVVVSILKR